MIPFYALVGDLNAISLSHTYSLPPDSGDIWGLGVVDNYLVAAMQNGTSLIWDITDDPNQPPQTRDHRIYNPVKKGSIVFYTTDATPNQDGEISLVQTTGLFGDPVEQYNTGLSLQFSITDNHLHVTRENHAFIYLDEASYSYYLTHWGNGNTIIELINALP